MEVETCADIKPKFAAFCKKYTDLDLKYQPVIAVIEKNDGIDAYVIFDNIFYKSSTFIHAIDTIFKLYFVLNIKYPFESIHVWHFIESFFYELESSDKSSEVLSLILQINSKPKDD